ncbi:unnamed protein product, partial [Hapterophycus canaliculatus]
RVICTVLLVSATACAFVIPTYRRTMSKLKESTHDPVEDARTINTTASCHVGQTADAAEWGDLEGLGEISSQYDAFLIDQWGVMHDGKTAYPGAVDCIDRLSQAGKKIVLLSNSSKRKGAALSNLEKMGFSTDAILDVVTSGQVAWDGLQQRAGEPFKSLGSKCLVFGNGDDDEEYVTSCGCELAEAKDADFILARGSFVVADSTGTRRFTPTVMTGEGKEQTHKAMRLMLERGAPMLVTNPDFLRPGTNDPMPGLIGRAYAEMGGTVHYVGKPHPAVYRACCQALGVAVDRVVSHVAGTGAMVVAVGDSLPHDILGAFRANISSVFVSGGVHFQELGVEQGAGAVPSHDAYSSAFSRHLEGEGTPTHVVPAFRW